MYQVKNSLAPQYLTDLFCKTSSIHDYNTRFAQDALALPKPNSNSLKKSFSYRGAVAWNNLPSDLKKIDSLLTFKRSISVELNGLNHISLILYFFPYCMYILYIITLFYMIFIVYYYIIYHNSIVKTVCTAYWKITCCKYLFMRNSHVGKYLIKFKVQSSYILYN